MGSQIDKEQIRRRFSKHLESYETEAVIQQQIAATLAEHFSACAPEKVARMLEVGCGTGFLTRELIKTLPMQDIYLNDLVPEALPALQERLRAWGCPAIVRTVPGDAEAIEIPDQLDLVASASAMQWFEALPVFFERISRSIRTGGYFIFNLFGEENLHQIKKLTGNGLEYLAFEELELLVKRHFEVIELWEEKYLHRFEKPFDVLRHLQQTGVTATGDFRWTKQSLRSFEREYAAQYSEEEKVVLTWDVIYGIVRKR